MTRNETVYHLAQEWLPWLYSKRFLGAEPSVNILAMLQPERSRSTREPDGNFSQELSAFNTAFNAQPLSQQIPFISIYCGIKPYPIKTIAGQLGIERHTLYNRAHLAANDIHKLMRVILEDRFIQSRRKLDLNID
jgi:hypothetical protein